MLNTSWVSQGPFRIWVQFLSPDAAESVPVRQEVQPIAVWRPAGFAIKAVTFGYGNPFGFIRSPASVNGYDEYFRVGCRPAQCSASNNPAAIRRKTTFIHYIFRMDLRAHHAYLVTRACFHHS